MAKFLELLTLSAVALIAFGQVSSEGISHTPEQDRNLTRCLSGLVPALCDHSKFSPELARRVAEAEARENLRRCLDGRYQNICDHSLLKPYERPLVAAAEQRNNSGAGPNGSSTGSAPPKAPSARPVQPFPAKVYVLLVYEKDGLYTTAAVSESRAFEDLVAYVKERWSAEMPAVPAPTDDDKLVEIFFEPKEPQEGYEILELPLLN